MEQIIEQKRQFEKKVEEKRADSDAESDADSDADNDVETWGWPQVDLRDASSEQVQCERLREIVEAINQQEWKKQLVERMAPAEREFVMKSRPHQRQISG